MATRRLWRGGTAPLWLGPGVPPWRRDGSGPGCDRRRDARAQVNTATHVLWVELPFLRKHLGCADDALFVSSCESEATAWPRPRAPADLATAAVMPETHAGYAFTWFALSAAGAVMSMYV